MILKNIAFLSILILSISSHAGHRKVIYGVDDRIDVYNSNDSLMVELSRSTAAMISKYKLKPIDGLMDEYITPINGKEAKNYEIIGSTLASTGICESEPFSDQIVAASCSGFLVGEDLLVTAGHCVRNMSDCRNYKWVFDFKMISEGVIDTTVSAENVVGCVEIISRELNSSTKNDYALLRINRKVTERSPLEFRKQGKIEDKASLVVIGHPSGLPTKIADGATARNNKKDVYFVANLDTYGGNSGSAVLNARTGIVEGILVRGERDYKYDFENKCNKSNVCEMDDCRGEDVTRITNIRELVNAPLN
jgi:V8-like Glu-specific endopeptidase